MRCIDGVVLFEEDTPAELLAYLRPNTLVKGGDYKIEDIIGRESVDHVEVLSFKEELFYIRYCRENSYYG